MFAENPIRFKKIDYLELNPKAKENYNFHQMAAILSNYGYN